MSPKPRSLTASQAAAKLGISTKALRLYEERGLIQPDRSATGWRAYRAGDMARAAEIASLRALGLSLAQVEDALRGEAGALEAGLAAHETRLCAQARRLAATIERVRCIRSEISQGRPPAPVLTHTRGARGDAACAFHLPWPWGGECFELHDVKPLNYITGPLGSGKTRFAKRLAEGLPDAAYLGLERLDNPSAFEALLEKDAALKARVEETMTWLTGNAARRCDALTALVAVLKADDQKVLVIDMVEQELDQATQEALMGYLRLTRLERPPLFLMTRSSSILDLGEVDDDETIIFCPANHSPPTFVAPYPGGPGREAVATCLAPPNVRARTAGMIAVRPCAAERGWAPCGR